MRGAKTEILILYLCHTLRTLLHRHRVGIQAVLVGGGSGVYVRYGTTAEQQGTGVGTRVLLGVHEAAKRLV